MPRTNKNTVLCSVCRRSLTAYGVTGDPAFERVMPDGKHVWRCENHLDDGGAVATYETGTRV